jgi:hypothetical protein
MSAHMACLSQVMQKFPWQPLKGSFLWFNSPPKRSVIMESQSTPQTVGQMPFNYAFICTCSPAQGEHLAHVQSEAELKQSWSRVELEYQWILSHTSGFHQGLCRKICPLENDDSDTVHLVCFMFVQAFINKHVACTCRVTTPVDGGRPGATI